MLFYLVNLLSISNNSMNSCEFLCLSFILFPKDEIGKYSNFKIEPVSVENITIDDSD